MAHEGTCVTTVAQALRCPAVRCPRPGEAEIYPGILSATVAPSANARGGFYLHMCMHKLTC